MVSLVPCEERNHVWARKGARQTAGHREGFLYICKILEQKKDIFPPTSPRTDSLGSVTPLENGVSAVPWHLEQRPFLADEGFESPWFL